MLAAAFIALAFASSTLAYGPTLAPINRKYEVQAFVTYLNIEQTVYPETRHDLSDVAVLECLSGVFVNLLPGVLTEDIYWDTNAIRFTQGIWNHQETTYLQFEVDYVPENIGYKFLGPGDVTYKGEPNPTDENGWNGEYSKNKDCRNCFDNHQVVYLQLKDLIAEYVTSKRFITDAAATCSPHFEYVTYAAVSFSEPSSATFGQNPGRKPQRLGLENLWILFVLLVPVGYVLYTWYAGAGFTAAPSKYEADRAVELSAVEAGGDAGAVEGGEENGNAEEQAVVQTTEE